MIGALISDFSMARWIAIYKLTNSSNYTICSLPLVLSQYLGFMSERRVEDIF